MGFVAELDGQACNRLSTMVSLDLTADGYRLPTEAEWELPPVIKGSWCRSATPAPTNRMGPGT